VTSFGMNRSAKPAVDAGPCVEDLEFMISDNLGIRRRDRRHQSAVAVAFVRYLSSAKCERVSSTERLARCQSLGHSRPGVRCRRDPALR
jgi:hypothetical protein